MIDLFEPRPSQFGLRGDLVLWRELQAKFDNVEAPCTLEAFERLFLCFFEESVGEKLATEKIYFVSRMNQGGMSGGMISGKFWIEKGLPLLKKRFAEKQKNF